MVLNVIRTQRQANRHFQGGFSLIELMITIAILGIITAIAVPSYNNHITNSRRDDAQNTLMQLHLRQQAHRLENTTYADASALGSPTHEFYTITVSNNTATTFTLTATAKTGTTQANDTNCTSLTINESSVRTPIACW